MHVKMAIVLLDISNLLMVVPEIFSCLNNDIVIKFHKKWNNILLGLYWKHKILKSIDVIIIFMIRLNCIFCFM